MTLCFFLSVHHIHTRTCFGWWSNEKMRKQHRSTLTKKYWSLTENISIIKKKNSLVHVHTHTHRKTKEIIFHIIKTILYVLWWYPKMQKEMPSFLCMLVRGQCYVMTIEWQASVTAHKNQMRKMNWWHKDMKNGTLNLNPHIFCVCVFCIYLLSIIIFSVFSFFILFFSTKERKTKFTKCRYFLLETNSW